VGGLAVGIVTYGLAALMIGNQEMREALILLRPPRRTQAHSSGD